MENKMKKLFLIAFLILFGCGPAISYDMQNSWKDVDEATDEVQAAQPLPDSVLIPPGGLTGQILMKQTNNDGDTYWADPPTGGTPIECNTLVQESASTVSTEFDWANQTNKLWIATKFVANETTTICKIAGMFYRVAGATLTGTGVAIIYTHNTVDDNPDAAIGTWSDPTDLDTIPEDDSDIFFTGGASDIVDGETYWVVYKADTINDPGIKYASTGDGSPTIIRTSEDGITWVNQSTSRSVRYKQYKQ